MRKQTLILTLALLVGFSTALSVPESWAQEELTQVAPTFSEADITPESVAKNPRFAE